MTRKIKLVTECYYHIYNRGIDKRIIFSDTEDYFRFIHYLYEFNDTKAVINFGWRFQYEANRNYRGLASIVKKARDKLVEIICYCLMPNHFHLILRQIKEEGISRFMLKLDTGYAMYFNKKNQRTGRLFEGPFKSILVDRDEYLIHLSRYTHLNPVELIEPNWKEEGIKNWQRVNEFLNNYKWSSYLDYIGRHNFPSIIKKEFLLSYFKGSRNYKKFVNEWMVDDIDKCKDLILE